MRDNQVRVLIIGNSLALSSVRALLEKKTGLDLFCATTLESKDIRRIAPDIVLIDQEIKGESEWNEILKDSKAAKLMVIDFENQEIDILNRSTSSIHSSQDLLDLLLNHYYL